MLYTVRKNCIGFFQKETVLSIAILLALVSCLAVPPSLDYVSYIDWNTLALLFSLMAVMQGFQKAGLFVYLGDRLLKRAATTRRMLFVLVFLPFVCSMVITNDVALITFIPFTFTVLRLAGQERLLVPLVGMQTVAANLGSMLTPMGNPQNLYLYSKSSMGFGDLCALMLPYILISACCLAVLILARKSVPTEKPPALTDLGSHKLLLGCGAGFLICLFGIFKVIPPLAIAAVVVLVLLVADRSLLAGVDYSLLGTFVAFFIFIGNLGCIEVFQTFFLSILSGHVEVVAVLASQVISNVPAALLLSGFTCQWPDLIVGCNLGGLGTLIASMASLISYKLVVKEYPAQRKRYFVWFSLCNVGLLAILLGANLLLIG